MDNHYEDLSPLIIENTMRREALMTKEHCGSHILSSIASAKKCYWMHVA